MCQLPTRILVLGGYVSVPHLCSDCYLNFPILSVQHQIKNKKIEKIAGNINDRNMMISTK